LSVFDYALWTTATGGPVAYVPMFRHSLFAQHFMPTLLGLSPIARLSGGPAWLIVIQALFHAAAAFLLYRFARRHASGAVALALTTAFLFSRRAHGAATSVFYIESAEPLLIFGALLARESRRLVVYWVLVVLALGCKEDVAIYLAVFGMVIAVVERDRRVGVATTVLSVVWLAVALGIAIPFSRGLYNLDSANPFLEGRYGGLADAAGRCLVGSARSPRDGLQRDRIRVPAGPRMGRDCPPRNVGERGRGARHAAVGAARTLPLADPPGCLPRPRSLVAGSTARCDGYQW
jgi:hypothetical protein